AKATAAPVDATAVEPVAPVSLLPEDRIPELDLIRGVTILGILLVNVRFFMSPSAGWDLQIPRTWWGDHAVMALLTFLVDGKMMSQLAVLFGVGLAIQADRARAAGRPFTGYYLRRQFLLLLIGLAHGFLLWYGDILSSYALVAMLALVLSWLSLRGIFWWSVGLFAWFYFWMLLIVAGVVVYFVLLATDTLPKEWRPETAAAQNQ